VARADVTGLLASPLAMEAFWTVKPGDRAQFVFQQNAETSGLYCGDETDGDSLRNCYNIYDPLYEFKPGSTEAVPDLAEKCAPNADGTVWTCTLRQGVKFADGASLDANDVVASYAAQWDKKNPNHIGNGGTFDYFGSFWGGLLNP
jgi:peptide/nickel transport system substrate-binding protein